MDSTLPAEIREIKRKARVFVDEKCIPLEKDLKSDWIEPPPEIQTNWWQDQDTGALGYAAVREEQCRSLIGTSHYTPFGREVPPSLFHTTDIKKVVSLPAFTRRKKGCLCAD
ncbi:MAG: hypothetical protein SWO11_14930 [Thermodesulfobacteriota bacterium]|nr:hypothetical protein [Thermodesulfobacteriota bacterium]